MSKTHDTPNVTVYLAGGFKTDWQSKVIEMSGPSFTFFNPKKHGLEGNALHYTIWDLFHVKQCDILFAYMENTNPSGYGLSLEVGYAKALNKTVILIDEKSPNDPSFERYFKIVQESADVIFKSFDEGVFYLNTFSNNF